MVTRDAGYVTSGARGGARAGMTSIIISTVSWVCDHGASPGGRCGHYIPDGHMVSQCCGNIADGGPALAQRCVNVSRFLRTFS